MELCGSASAGITIVVAGIASASVVIAADTAEDKNPDQPFTAAIAIAVAAKKTGAVSASASAAIIVAAAEKQ